MLAIVEISIPELLITSISSTSLEIVGKGLVFSDDMIAEAKLNVVHALEKVDLRTVRDEAELNGIIRRSIKNYVYKVTKKNPMILPVVMVV